MEWFCRGFNNKTKGKLTMEKHEIVKMIEETLGCSKYSYIIRNISTDEAYVEVSYKGKYMMFHVIGDYVEAYTMIGSFKVVEDPIEAEKVNPCAFELTEIY